MGSLITYYIKEKTIFDCAVYLNDKEKEGLKQILTQISEARWSGDNFIVFECDFDWREYDAETLSLLIELNLTAYGYFS